MEIGIGQRFFKTHTARHGRFGVPMAVAQKMKGQSDQISGYSPRL